MKKNSMKPSLLVVELQLQNSILQALVTSANSESAGIGNGSDGSDLGADVKGSKNIWDEEW